MSKAMQLVGIILLGIFTLVIIYLMSDVRSTNELDYYLLQEVTEASMYDAVDYSYYRDTGLLKVDRDMFLENFTRRFAESVANNREYKIDIIDFNETPPKVSIRATANTIASVSGETAVIETTVDGILETIYDDLVMSRGLYKEDDIKNDPPVVNVTQDINNNRLFKISMEDDNGLEQFCFVKTNANCSNLKDSKCTIKAKDCKKIGTGQTKYEVEETVSFDSMYQEWVEVYDIGGATAYQPLGIVPPYIANVKYYDGKLTLDIRGKSKIKDYKILVDNSDSSSNSSTWTNYKLLKNDEIEGGFYRTNAHEIEDTKFAIEGTHTYYIFARDVNNLISAPQKLTFTYVKKQGSKPETKQADYEYTDGKSYLKLTFFDMDGDLKGDNAYYCVTKNNSVKICGKIETEDGKTGYGKVSIPTESGTYHVTVSDNEKNQNTQDFHVRTYILAVLTCGTGATLKDGKCYYDSNAAVCGSDTVQTSPGDTNCSVCPSGWDHSQTDDKCHRSDQNFTYVCPSGYTPDNHYSPCYKEVGKLDGNTCPSGSSLDNGKCIKTTPKIKVCPSGATKSGDYCYYVTNRNTCNGPTYGSVAKSCYKDGTYSCPNGGTLENGKCYY